MSILDSARDPWPSRALSLVRIIFGLVFMTSGTMKLFGWPASPMPMPHLDLLSEMGIGGILEVFGGLCIVLGLFTRPVAFILAGEMAVAYFQFHYPTAFFPTQNMGVPAVLFCFFFLYLVVAGAGEWSLDAALARARQHRRQDGERHGTSHLVAGT